MRIGLARHIQDRLQLHNRRRRQIGVEPESGFSRHAHLLHEADDFDRGLIARVQCGYALLSVRNFGALHIELRAGTDLKPCPCELQLCCGCRDQRVLQRRASLRLQCGQVLRRDIGAQTLLGGRDIGLRRTLIELGLLAIVERRH